MSLTTPQSCSHRSCSLGAGTETCSVRKGPLIRDPLAVSSCFCSIEALGALRNQVRDFSTAAFWAAAVLIFAAGCQDPVARSKNSVSPAILPLKAQRGKVGAIRYIDAGTGMQVLSIWSSIVLGTFCSFWLTQCRVFRGCRITREGSSGRS